MGEETEFYNKCYETKRREGSTPKEASDSCSRSVNKIFGKTTLKIGNKIEASTTKTNHSLILIIFILALATLGLLGYIIIF